MITLLIVSMAAAFSFFLLGVRAGSVAEQDLDFQFEFED